MDGIEKWCYFPGTNFHRENTGARVKTCIQQSLVYKDHLYSETTCIYETICIWRLFVYNDQSHTKASNIETSNM